ncbi:MAG: hypothetical protein JNM56_29060 [Planctomycetia bacterium]|nr:hypothetical protein [Planctomycetia bacterium]
MKRPDVQAFRCGTGSHETPLAEWIKVHSAEHIACGTKVWLYRRQHNDGPLVGYGSLSTGKIRTTEKDGSKREILMFEIPMLVLHQDFWGHPKGCTDLEEKYSRQIVRHLQQEAKAAQIRGNRERLLTLYVHPDAKQAQKLYEDCEFTFAPGRFLTVPEIHPEQAPGLLGMDFVWC